MANTTFSGPVRSLHGFEMATKNSVTGTVTTRYSSGMPDLTGLLFADTATAANIAIADGVIAAVNFTGAAACACALPAATSGAIAVYVQSKDPAGAGGNTLTFNAAGTDVWQTSSLIESRAAGEVTFDTSTAGETALVYTPANAATNLMTTGGKIAFMCFEDGIWTIATSFSTADNATTGAFLFAA
mgnify:FL=1|tara:strand:- start:60 stop:617 length:558 start_codon:yes stop_codon:yes gene_type:complete